MTVEQAAAPLHRPVEEYSPGEPQPLGGYAAVMSVFLAAASAFAAWFRLSGRELPERVSAGDLALLTIASQRAARTIAKDKVTSPLRAPFVRYEGPAGPGEVSEQPRGQGLHRVVGELLVCPYCLGMWTSAALTAGLLVAPRVTRWLCVVLRAFFGADLLQVAYKRAEDAL